jgi:spermidine synthase
MRFPFERALPITLFRVAGPTGECVLQRREEPPGAPVYELVLNGRLLMDSAEHRSEEALAEVALAACAGDRLEVLVGGLGFGFTVGAALRDPRVARVEVVELEPLLAEAISRPGVRAELGAPDLADPRVTLRPGDVRARLAAAAAAFDAILLDVDNGPESLSAAENAALYTAPGLARCRDALRPGGVLAIWSSEPAPACLAELGRTFDEAAERLVPIARAGRTIPYRILTGRRAR